MTWTEHLASPKEKNLGLNDGSDKISSVYELESKIFLKNHTISGIVSSTLPTSHT